MGVHAGVLCAAVRAVIHPSPSGQVGFRKGLTAPVSPDVPLKDCLSGRFLVLGHASGTGAVQNPKSSTRHPSTACYRQNVARVSLVLQAGSIAAVSGLGGMCVTGRWGRRSGKILQW